MTVEIGVLNKTAVALGADSAITVTAPGNRRRIYTNVNKLFALSPEHPVGLMIFGSDQIMGVPWESVIKLYGRKPPKEPLPTLSACTDRFFHTIESDRLICSAERQAKYLRDLVDDRFNDLAEKTRVALQAVVEAAQALPSEVELRRVVDDTIMSAVGVVAPPNAASANLIAAYAEHLSEAKTVAFGQLPMSPTVWDALQMWAVGFVTDESAWRGGSGLVFAGFGAEDVFPSILSFETFGIVGGWTQRRSFRKSRVSFDQPAAIVTFAQDEEIQTILHGIHPSMETALKGAVRPWVAIARQVPGRSPGARRLSRNRSRVWHVCERLQADHPCADAGRDRRAAERRTRRARRGARHPGVPEIACRLMRKARPWAVPLMSPSSPGEMGSSGCAGSRISTRRSTRRDGRCSLTATSASLDGELPMADKTRARRSQGQTKSGQSRQAPSVKATPRPARSPRSTSSLKAGEFFSQLQEKYHVSNRRAAHVRPAHWMRRSARQSGWSRWSV